MESAIYLMFAVNLESSVKNDLYICRDYHIQPSELKRLPYFQYEIMVDCIQEINKKAEEDEKKREKNNGLPEGYSMPKMPSFPSMSSSSMPTVSIPHL